MESAAWPLQRPPVGERESTGERAIQLHVDELLANVGMLHERGVPIVLGTDTGTLFSFAGFSVHDELEFLVEAGLTPGEALESATRRAAEMLDADDESIQPRTVNIGNPPRQPCANLPHLTERARDVRRFRGGGRGR